MLTEFKEVFLVSLFGAGAGIEAVALPVLGPAKTVEPEDACCSAATRWFHPAASFSSMYTVLQATHSYKGSDTMHPT